MSHLDFLRELAVRTQPIRENDTEKLLEIADYIDELHRIIWTQNLAREG